LGIGVKIDRPIFDAIKQSEPDLVWVDQGAYLGANLIASLRTLSAPIVNYTLDDPFSGRDGRRFDRYLKALPFYDLLVVIREENVAEAYARGAQNVLRVWRSADEVAHRPRLLTDEDRQRWGAEVCFVRTWFPERGPFMAELVRACLCRSGAIVGRKRRNGWRLRPIGADQAKTILKFTRASSSLPKSPWGF
jgi:spore maturation protein CgeB